MLFRSGIKQALDCVSNLGNDIQALTHRLHSPKLEYLGLERASASFCSELSVRHKVKIDFHSENIPKNLPKEVSFCLFRVLQEALHNSPKHSGVRHFGVRLWLSSDKVHLAVSDSGAGFDIKTAMKGRGLGLTSMRERVRLVNGTIVIDSKPMGGTTIHVFVPLESQQASQRESV